MLSEQQQRIMGYFIEEAKDHLNTIEQGLINLQSTIADSEMVHEVFRAAHSVKGGAAMLGLNSIQHTAHRLEDYFKVLKECPQVQVDQKLETLFLRVYDTLQDQVDHLQGPFGLTDDKAQEAMATVEPVFAELNQHLIALVEQAGGTTPEDVELTSTPVVQPTVIQPTVAQPQVGQPVVEESVLRFIFQNDVPARLREMLQLFKQAESTENREQLQHLCRVLAQPGEQFSLVGWCELLKTAQQAIANSDNTYRVLAPIIIKDVKWAQELVLANRFTEISACEELLDLLPPNSFSEEEQVLESELADLLGWLGSDDSSFALTESTCTDSDTLGTNPDLSTELFGAETFAAETDWFTDMSTQDEIEGTLQNGHEAELNFDLEFEQISSAANHSDDLDLSFIDRLNDAPLTSELSERNGPEMGAAELNSLADLFEGELPDLGLTWQDEEVINSVAPDQVESQLENSNNFFDLLDQDNSDDLVLDEAQEDDLSGLLNAATQATHQSGNATLAFQPSVDPFTADTSTNDLSLGEVHSTDSDLSLDLSFDFELPEPTSSDSDDMAMFFFTDEPDATIAPTSSEKSEDKTATSGFQNLDALFAGIEVDELTVDETEPFDRPEVQVSDFTSELTSSHATGNEMLAETLDSYGISSEVTPSELPELQVDEPIAPDLESPSTSIENFDFDSDFDDKLAVDDVIVLDLESSDKTELSLAEGGAEVVIADNSDFVSFFEGEDSSDCNPLFESKDNLDAAELDLNVLFGAETHPAEITNELDAETVSDFDALNDLFTEDDSGEIENTELEHPIDTIFTATIDEISVTDTEIITTEDIDFDLGLTYTGEAASIEEQNLELPLFESLPASELASEIGFEKTVEQDTEIIKSVDTESVNEFIEVSGDEAEASSSLDLLELNSLDHTLESSLEENSELLSDVNSDSNEEAFNDLADIFVGELNELDKLNESDTSLDTGDSSNNVLALDIELIDAASHSEIPLEMESETALNSAESNNSELISADNSTVDNTDFALFLLPEDEAVAGVEAVDDLFTSELEFETEFVEPQVNLEAIEATQPDFAFADLEFIVEDSLQNTSPLQGISDIAAGSENVTETIALDDEFADLEAMLGDELPASVTAPLAEPDEFADLEALLGNEPLHAPPASASPPVSAKTDDEFGDLEALLQDADQKLGVGSSPVRNSASAANRRPNRRNVIADQTMRVSVKHLDNLNNLVGEMVVNRNSLEQTQERLRQFLDNLLYQVQQLSDVGQRMRDLYERSLLESSLLASRRSYHLSGNSSSSAQTSHATGASFDALEMDKFTGFHTLSQEMIELIVRVRESASDIDFVVEESDQVTRNFRQITTQLQEGLTRSRMVPFAQTADRLPRGVRDNAIKYGKQAELAIEGRDTLIDKMIVEQLYDPMTHLVNNAIAHGIETPQERIAAGKPPTGRITIRTFHQGNQTVISVSDDGAGIDTEAVKAKAIAKRLITPAEAKQMSRLEAYDLLFHHGFSTADTVDDLRGRGVGLDVVRNNLSEIRGSISIDSAIGKGSTFTIRLPLTLSISKALCCISNRARIAFPMDGVEDMLDVPKDRVFTDEQGQPCIQWRDVFLPFKPLSDLLKYNRVLGRGSVYGGNQEDDMLSIVVLRSAGNYLALQVDQVLGEQEIVIKQLEGPAPKPVGVAGATVLGDGRIMPIADVLELIDLSQGRIRREAGNALWETSGDQLTQDAVALKTDPTVLIVDDSITVRELLSMTFNKVGYRVEQARDGQEAWEKLRSGLPCDLVFCDIEMPRMDGLELLSRLQKDSNLCHIPIAMLTSRGADRHRQMAVQLGAKGYFTKPYLEEMLLDAAQRMLKGEVLVTSAGS